MKKLSLIILALGIVFNVMSQEVADTTQLKEVVITATKSSRHIKDIPARVTIIDAGIIEASAVQQLDDVLRFTSGVNVNRSSGIFSQRPMITLRGLSGDEQARTLVLLNGIPINTSDEGGVNWNRINQYDIERIEIFKGPGSSLYGNNAMGGVINIITKTPDKPQEVYGGFSYGTFNTLRQDLNVRVRGDKGFYGAVSQYYLQSDGYNNIPDSVRTPYDIESFLESMGISARLGNDSKKWAKWEVQYDVFREKRGEGYMIYAPEGCYRHFNTNLVRTQLQGGHQKTSYNLSAYYQLEHYYDINERMRNNNYSRYDVNSLREDMGAFFNINQELISNNTLTGGFEYKMGSIKGGDYYQTAPFDTIFNGGKLTTLAAYVQDEHKLLNNKLHLLAGLRFDQVTFSDGEFFSTAPWNTQPAIKDDAWTALSPRAGIRYNITKKLSSYVSYARGFRASILDDLTRTGWMWVGPKYANPELKPEYIDNYELGLDIKAFDKLSLGLSAYFTEGKDFLYYVQTGDSIFGRPIYRRENVTNIEVKGFEAELTYFLTERLRLMGSYTFTESIIKGFDERPELENKSLKYVPRHTASLTMLWENKYLNMSVRGLYKDRQFGDDLNEKALEDYVTVDLMLYRTFANKFMVSLDVQNIFDVKHMENLNYLSPGRLITGRLALKI